MAPKKEKEAKAKKGAEDEAAKGPAVTEVEQAFLDLQLTECNRKVARLRTTVDELEQRNEELEKAYEKLDEDRADIIAYLKKTLNTKNEENQELKEKVKGLEEIREIETAQFKETVAELEKNFTIMKDQLTSENKLLAGKLNTLEEFRAIRDDLMKKFEKQEQDFLDQEMKYKRIIYEAEKKFVIGKDKLKKEMEARLLQLAQDFQDATELRIAASTHRVIRENIAINNELDNILSTQSKLSEQNEKFRESEKNARIAKELAEEERDKAINKNVVQLKVIDQLTTAFQEAKKERALYKKRTFDLESLQAKIQKLTKENENLALQVRILEQNLHARMSDQNKATIEATKVAKEASKLKKILKEAAAAVQAALKLDQWATTDPTREIMDRQILLSRLLEIVSQYREVQRAESMDTLASFGKIYEEGDLGFIPKPVKKKPSVTGMTVIGSVASKESIKPSEKASELSITPSTSTLGSIKTIPSIQLIPRISGEEIAPKDSLPSFVTSQTSESEESEIHLEAKSSVEEALAASKLAMQQSLMADLVMSKSIIGSKSQLTIDKSHVAKSQETLGEADESGIEKKGQSGEHVHYGEEEEVEAKAEKDKPLEREGGDEEAKEGEEEKTEQ